MLTKYIYGLGVGDPKRLEVSTLSPPVTPIK